MTIILHDLAGADPDLRFSPYCWRTRFALAHKGLLVETVPWRFTDKAALAFSGQDRVPVIHDGDRVVSDSWAIAEYLEDRYPTPSLFGDATGRAHARFINSWADSVMLPAIAPLIIRDLLDVVAPQDRDYFRTSREARFGTTLEDLQSTRDARLPAFQSALMPLRMTLRRQAWLGGGEPSYADFIVGGTLMWPRCASRYQVLAPDDAVTDWFGRLLALFSGVGQQAKTP